MDDFTLITSRQANMHAAIRAPINKRYKTRGDNRFIYANPIF